MKLASIDVAGTRNLDCAWVSYEDCVVHHRLLPTTEAVLEWVETELPDAIAIDAPSKQNIGRTRNEGVRQKYRLKSESFLNCRVCEALLKQKNIGLYYTPQDSAAEWIKKGWELYDGL